jgi:hypothetical protein
MMIYLFDYITNNYLILYACHGDATKKLTYSQPSDKDKSLFLFYCHSVTKYIYKKPLRK